MSSWSWLNIVDPHLEKLTKLFGYDRGLNYQFQALNKQVKYARDVGIKYVVVTGDVFDNPNPEQEAIVRLINFFHENDDMLFKVYLGNHDFCSNEENALKVLDTIASLNLLKNVSLYIKPTLVHIKDIPVAFLPWPHHNPKALKGFKRGLVFTHVEYKGYKRDTGMVSTTGIEYDSRGDIHTVSGHLHTQQDGNPYYPGTALQYTFGDTPQKTFTVSEMYMTKTGYKVDHSKIDFTPPYTLENVKIHEEADLKKVPTKENTLVKLHLTKGLKLPDTWLMDHANVIDWVDPWSKTLKEEIVSVEDTSVDFDIEETVVDAIQVSDVLDKNQKKRALQLFKDIYNGTQTN